jgi:PGF-pre-PGF domain-containing protein
LHGLNDRDWRGAIPFQTRGDQPHTNVRPRGVLRGTLLFLAIALLAISPVSAAHVVATINLPPPGPSSLSNLVVNPSTNFLYVGSAWDAPGDMYVINRGTNTVATTIAAAPTGGDIAVNPATNKIYYANQGSGSCTVINGNTNTVLSTIAVPGCPTGIAANNNTNKIYVSSQCCPNGVCDGALVIDGATDTLLPGTLSLGGVAGGVVADPIGNRIYARGTWDTAVIDGSSDSVIATISSFIPAAVNPLKNRIYGSCADSNFCIVNATTYANELSLPWGSWPGLMAVDPGTNRIYVALSANDTLVIFDGNTNLEITRVDVGDNPWGVSFNPDTKRAYVVNSNDRTISVVQDVLPPVAGFSGTPTSGTAPLTVTFTDTSTNTPASWNWSFGDGSLVNATDQDPVHTYAGAGTYTVSLNATNEGGSNTQALAGYVTVNMPPPVAGFSGTPTSGTAPLTVTFTDTSTNTPASWNWSFGDGSLVNVTDQDPVHSFASAGTYTVSLNATNAAGSNTLMRVDYITVNAAPAPTPAPSGGSSSGTGSSSSSSPGAGTSTAAMPGAARGETITLVFNQPTTSAAPVAVQQVQVVPSEGVGPVEMQAVSIVPEVSMQVRDREVIGYKRIEPLGFKPGAISHGRITFTVISAWLAAHHVTPAQIVMERYHENQWAEVPTRFDHEKDGVSYFIADTPGFSYFAITVKPPAGSITAVPTPSPATTPLQARVQGTIETVVTGTTSAPPAPVSPPLAGNPVVAGIVILVAVALAAFSIRRWWIRRQNPALFRELD